MLRGWATGLDWEDVQPNDWRKDDSPSDVRRRSASMGHYSVIVVLIAALAISISLWAGIVWLARAILRRP